MPMYKGYKSDSANKAAMEKMKTVGMVGANPKWKGSPATITQKPMNKIPKFKMGFQGK